MSIATAVSTINVPFHGAELYVVSHNGEPYVPMKPVVEGMGMVWAAQFVKLKQRFEKGISEIEIPSSGGTQKMICLALRKLSAWLASIQPNKVKPEIRDTVIRYQDECDDVLYEYWTKGVAVNPRKGKPTAAGKITLDQQEAIKQLVINRGKSLPKQHQAKAMITMWSSLKSHFGCSYKEIAEENFAEALSIAARVPLEGELLPKEPQPANPAMPIFPIGIDFQYVVTVESGCVIEMRPLRQGEMVTSAEDAIWMLRKTGWVVELAEDMDAMNSTALAQLIQRSAAMRIQAF